MFWCKKKNNKAKQLNNNTSMSEHSGNVLIVVDLQWGFVHAHNRDIVDKVSTFISEHKFDTVIKCMWVNNERSNFHKMVKYVALPDEKSSDFASCIPDDGTQVISRTRYNAVNEQLRDIVYTSDTVYVCGLETDACVLATCFGLFDEKYNFKVIEDLCSTKWTALHPMALSIMQRNFGKDILINSTEVNI